MERLALAFMSDALVTGRKLRVLTVIDEYSKESPAIEVEHSMSGDYVVEVLRRMAASRGLPASIRLDNGPELRSKALVQWAAENQVDLCYITPGKPTENCYIESFNGRVREECLDQELFLSLADAKQKLAAWREFYNSIRPHAARGGRPPYAAYRYSSIRLPFLVEGRILQRPMRTPPSPTLKPRFVVFEGVNGSGKSTLMANLAATLRSEGRRVTTTHEPGHSSIGPKLRALLLEQGAAKISAEAELLLFSADRAQHLAEVVRPALSQGEIVLCDRYIYSTIAFQGYGRGLDRATIDSANEVATSGLRPDLVVLLDLDTDTAAQRIAIRKDGGQDRFEDEAREFQLRIRAGFLELADKLPEPFLVLDATLPPEQLAASVRELLA
jgi:dTMP kinase